MLGLAVLFAIGAYLFISLLVVRLSARWAKKRGRKGWVWGGVAAFAMYNVVFWDLIPTLVMHTYYCSTEAGFWVYKTPEQWVKENPGVMETLASNNGLVRKSVGDGTSYTDTSSLNSRFDWVLKKSGPSIFNRWRREQKLVDKNTGEVLARYVDFSTGNGNLGGQPPFKFWLQGEHCIDGKRNDSLMWQFTENFMGVKK